MIKILEKLKICEPNNSFVYSNEILNFKKLMPVSNQS